MNRYVAFLRAINVAGHGVVKMDATVAFHMRTGTHGQHDYDWEQFMNFVDEQFGAPTR
jgi:hypothetical protein